MLTINSVHSRIQTCLLPLTLSVVVYTSNKRAIQRTNIQIFNFVNVKQCLHNNIVGVFITEINSLQTSLQYNTASVCITEMHSLGTKLQYKIVGVSITVVLFNPVVFPLLKCTHFTSTTNITLLVFPLVK